VEAPASGGRALSGRRSVTDWSLRCVPLGTGHRLAAGLLNGMRPVLTLELASCCKHGRRWITVTVSEVMSSLVVSGGVDCGRRRQNVYDKKPRRYAKDNRTAHLTARSDKSVAYVTNNRRLYSTFCTVEANY